MSYEVTTEDLVFSDYFVELSETTIVLINNAANTTSSYIGTTQYILG